MTDPCSQRDKIDAIAHTLERMEVGQERLVALLEKVANQDARIEHVEEHAENAYRDMNEIFNRLRECELNLAANGHDRINGAIEELTRKVEIMNTRLEKIVSKYNIITSKPALYFYSSIVVAVIISMMSNFANHYDWLKSIWKFWKGD